MPHATIPQPSAARSEDPPCYGQVPAPVPDAAHDPTTEAITRLEDSIIAHALSILASRLQTGSVLVSPQSVKDYLQLALADAEHEQFAILFLNVRHRVITFEVMFRGTLTQTSVYPREVVKRALQLNAAAVIFSHNHPSGHSEPSRADEQLTQALKSALALVNVHVLDHIVVSVTSTTSMAERDLI